MKYRLHTFLFIALFLTPQAWSQSIFDYEDNDITIEEQYNIKDPLEKVNRKIFKFNYYFDKYALRPLAISYNKITPTPVRKGLRNFNNNLQRPISFITSLLMLDFKNAGLNLRDFSTDTSFGMFGFFYISYYFKDSSNKENFASLLTHYNTPQGIYLMLPFIGPQSTRSALGLALDTTLNPVAIYEHNKNDTYLITQIGSVTNTLDIRAQNFTTINNIYDDSLDPYIAMRNIYYQMQ